jgi:hypothetical protein
MTWDDMGIGSHYHPKDSTRCASQVAKANGFQNYQPGMMVHLNCSSFNKKEHLLDEFYISPVVK